jgi:hypothetical protein
MASLGCSSLDNCPAARDDIFVETGVTNLEAKIYHSAPPWGPRNSFPAKTTVHFVHNLGFTPEIRQSFVSFDADVSDSSENAGNQGRWTCSDDREFAIKNDTCENFYIFVTAFGSGDLHAPCFCDERDEKGHCPKSSVD